MLNGTSALFRPLVPRIVEDFAGTTELNKNWS